ncbi:MAG: dihydroorotase [Pirellulales bacterium]
MKSSERILIQNGRVIDPSQGIDRIANVLIAGGRIVELDGKPSGDCFILDATDRIVAPGFVDPHVELREPGCEEDGTIETETAAALAGGFTSIACLPNSEPPLDTQAGVEFVHQKASRAKNVNVFAIACVSKNREGKELSEMGALAEAGAVAFSDAPRPVFNTDLLRRAFEYSQMFQKPIFDRPEVLELTHGGVMHEGRTSLVLGLTGMPVEAEEVATSRDLRLAEATGGRLHLVNISAAGSVELVRRAKTRGVKVTASASIANLVLTDERLRTFDTNYKVNPPLRSADHVECCLAGIVDGTIDVISSGHAPRAAEKKMRELDQAPFGMNMLELTLALANTHLIHPGLIDWPVLLARLTCNPARILGISKGTLRPGADADVVVIDPHARWTVDPLAMKSKSSNTPFGGVELIGRIDHALVGGELRF